MKTLFAIVLSAGLLFAAAGQCAEPAWKEGRHYFAISPAQPKMNSANAIEVVEAFSYGCPACDRFYVAMEKIKKALPANARVEYLPASFNRSESWPLFQQAFFTAQALGVADKTHRAMFDAIWKTYELGVVNPATDRLKTPPPSLEDVAKFYSRTAGVKPETFLSTARSFSIAMQMKRADEMMKKYRVEQTPTIIINGKYRVTASSAGGDDECTALVAWLVAQEAALLPKK